MHIEKLFEIQKIELDVNFKGGQIERQKKTIFFYKFYTKQEKLYIAPNVEARNKGNILISLAE